MKQKKHRTCTIYKISPYESPRISFFAKNKSINNTNHTLTKKEIPPKTKYSP